MKKISNIAVIISILILSVVPMVGLINSADAEIISTGVGIYNTPAARDANEWLDVIRNVITWVYAIFIIVAIIFVLIAAFQYLTSSGSQDKVKKATNMLMYAAIAIVVAVLAFSITRIIGTIIGEDTL